MIADSINSKLFDFVARFLFRLIGLHCLIACGETDSAFRSRIALHDPSVVVTVYTYYFETAMKISYDPEVDALSITLRETTVTTKHLAEGVAAD